MLDMSLIIRSQRSSTYTFAERLKLIAAILRVYKRASQDAMTGNSVFDLVCSPQDRLMEALSKTHSKERETESDTEDSPTCALQTTIAKWTVAA